ncbi:MAG: aspartate-semialdehyde dehydrogenase [Mariniblastus sp.]|nr:aspartate-semialdehyde dehydrogenase [Mariniblastus sp.]
MNKNIAIVGATGAVGTLVRELLVERNFPYGEIRFLASEKSAGKELEFDGRMVTVELLCPTAFDGIDIAIGSTPDDVAREFTPWAVQAGAVVVDESAAHRMLPEVPLVVPEVNPGAIAEHQGIIASPNCSTTQMVLAMKPIHDVSPIRRVVVTTYQATSGAGVQGSADLENGTRAALEEAEWEGGVFQHPIAFNVIPQIGSVQENGYTSEEMKMVLETRKIFADDAIEVCPTCVRVPVRNCHSESILLETDHPITPQQAREVFAAAPGIQVMDDPGDGIYPMPLNCDDLDDVFVGRIRRDLSCKNSLAFWCVSDNLRKGAATNAVQIAELLASSEFSKCRSSN